jgi:hypothetical protein
MQKDQVPSLALKIRLPPSVLKDQVQSWHRNSSLVFGVKRQSLEIDTQNPSLVLSTE